MNSYAYKKGLKGVYLKPGEIYMTKDPTVVSTVLGSCVSVTLFNRRLGIGAICHALFPEAKEDVNGDGFKYVDYALSKIIDKFDSMGIKLSEIETKLFGGSDIVEMNDEDRLRPTVGKQNIDAAFNLIKNRKLRLISSDVGGLEGRKIIFYTHTGEVFLRRLSDKKNKTLVLV